MRHALYDYKDSQVSDQAFSCSYSPFKEFGVVNASAYRAFLLFSAGIELGYEKALKVARGNLNFVIESQQKDGSWFYAMDGKRDFVDHFHTCFVLKALAKIYRLGEQTSRIGDSIERGLNFYTSHLIDDSSLPKPFARAPRMTVYKKELYDYAECVNLCVLLCSDFPQVRKILNSVLEDLLKPMD